jgi:hypothetical protein
MPLLELERFRPILSMFQTRRSYTNGEVCRPSDMAIELRGGYALDISAFNVLAFGGSDEVLY